MNGLQKLREDRQAQIHAGPRTKLRFCRGLGSGFLGVLGALWLLWISPLAHAQDTLPLPPAITPSLDTNELLTTPASQQVIVVPGSAAPPVPLPNPPAQIPTLDQVAAEGTTIETGVGREIVIEKAAETTVERAPDPGYTERTIPVVFKERSSGKTIRVTPGEGLEIVEPRPVARLDPVPQPSRLDGDGYTGEPIESEQLLYPLPVAVPITSGFGLRQNPVTGASEFHQGIDLGAAMGTPILAAYSGIVLAAGSSGGYGNLVVISHGTARTRYGHMSQINVITGQAVTQGSVIGYVGSTGLSTGPHLHFELWRQAVSGDWQVLDAADLLKVAVARLT